MRPSVLRAVCELRFALSAHALEALLRTLTTDYPVQRQLPDSLVYELHSQDGVWTSLISPHHASVTAPEGSPVEDFSERFRRFGASLKEALRGELMRSVRVHCWDALPLLPSANVAELLNKALREGPWEHRGEFEQTLTGTSRGCQFVLWFGVHYFQEEPCYLAEANVVALDVHTEALSGVIERLGDEGAQLLTWPLSHKQGRREQEAHRDQLSHYFRWMLERRQLTDPEQINDERVSLLTRKHLAKSWTERDSARLEELTARVRALWPKVTSADWYALGRIENRIGERAERLREIERELGLKLAS